MTATDDLTWTTARTLADLGELTARWIEGRIPTVPGYIGPPETETALIAGELAALNRGGLLTYQSQPAGITEHGRTRAFVDLLVDAQRAAAIERELLPTELVVTNYRPRGHGTRWLPVTLGTDGRVYTEAGGAPSLREITWWHATAGVSRPLRRQVRRLHRVTVIDPCWGRNDLLWQVMDDVATTTAPYQPI